MNSRQIKALTLHDRKVCNDVIKENAEVYVYFSRNKSDKMSLKWTGLVRIIKEDVIIFDSVSKAKTNGYKMENKGKT